MWRAKELDSQWLLQLRLQSESCPPSCQRPRGGRRAEKVIQFQKTDERPDSQIKYIFISIQIIDTTFSGYMFVYTHMWAYIHIHVHRHTCMGTHRHAHMHVGIHTPTHEWARTHTHMSVCVVVCVCMCMLAYMFQCFRIYVRVYILLNIKIVQKITRLHITETNKQTKQQMFYLAEGRKELYGFLKVLKFKKVFQTDFDYIRNNLLRKRERP